MAHVRKSIRDNIITALTGLTTTGTRVYQSRVYAVHTDKLPALFVYTSSEQSERIGMTPMTYGRTVTVNVEAVVHAGSNYDNTLDTICKEVEIALQDDLTRNNLAKDTRIVSFESEFSDQADKPLARGTIQVEVDYYTLETDPETAV